MSETRALTFRELRKWFRDPWVIVMTVAQPIIWLGLFGRAFNLNALGNLPQSLFGGATDYFTYMAPGMLSVVVLFTAMLSGYSMTWDRRLGFLSKLVAAPISRSSITLSKILSSVVRGVLQAALVFLVALAFGLQLASGFGLLELLIIFSALILLNLGLSSLFVALTIRVKSWEAQTAVMNLLNLPLTFASSALFPIGLMPSWLQIMADANPLSYATDAVRQAILLGVSRLNIQALTSDFLILAGFSLTFTLVGAWAAGSGLKR